MGASVVFRPRPDATAATWRRRGGITELIWRPHLRLICDMFHATRDLCNVPFLHVLSSRREETAENSRVLGCDLVENEVFSSDNHSDSGASDDGGEEPLDENNSDSVPDEHFRNELQ